MAMMGISIVPVGTGSPSVSSYVAEAVKVLQKEPGIKYELTAMMTIVEGDVSRLMEIAQKMHNSAFSAGARRVVTSIRIDDRRDKPVTIASKVKSVKDKLRKDIKK
jgi:uncharacterized protein (TIGR00106 family)